MTDSYLKINPQMASVLARLKETARQRERAGDTEGGIAATRIRAHEDFAYWNEGGPQPAEIVNAEVPGAFGPTKIRLYRARPDTAPTQSGKSATLIYFHGGGWIVGDLDLEDRFLRSLCIAAGSSNLNIISVDYALAPEHPFPQPIEDCLAVTRHLHSHTADWQIDESRLFLGGGSAGANLAMATALMLRDAGETWLRGLALVTGVFTTADDSASRKAFADDRVSPGGPGMAFFLSQYLEDPADKTNPLVSPVLADLQGLPPVYLIAAELDSLKDDSIELDSRLRQAGVECELSIYAGVIHGFPLFLRKLDAGKDAVERLSHWLDQRIHKSTVRTE